MTTYLTCFGGVGEIGGNKLLLETAPAPFTPLARHTAADATCIADSATRLLLDFGTSFTQEKTYFSGWLKPRAFAGIADLLRLGVLPQLSGLYREDVLFESGISYCEPLVDGVILSHIHADHVGNLPYLDPAIPVYSTPVTLALLQFLQETQSVGETAYRSGKRRVPKKNQQRLKKAEIVRWNRATVPWEPNTTYQLGSCAVTLCPVDHSAPMTTACFVETPDALLIYSADLRRHGYNAHLTDQFVQYAQQRRAKAAARGVPTVLLCEGTRIDVAAGRSEADVAADLATFIAEADVQCGLVIASWSVLDVDRLRTFLAVAKQAGRTLAISPRQMYLLHQLASVVSPAVSGWPDPDDPALRVFFARKVSGDLHTTDYDTFAHAAWHNGTRRVTYQEVQAHPLNYIVWMGTGDLPTLLDLDLSQPGIFIYSKSEPHDPEMELTDQLWERWCDRFQLARRTSHASGHASGPELRAIITAIAPDLLIPIHTEAPEAFLSLHEEGMVPRVLLPQAGEIYDLHTLVSPERGV